MQLASNFIARIWKSAVGWSFAVTALRAGGFLLVLPLALRRLSPDELGRWYVFTSNAGSYLPQFFGDIGPAWHGQRARLFGLVLDHTLAPARRRYSCRLALAGMAPPVAPE